MTSDQQAGDARPREQRLPVPDHLVVDNAVTTTAGFFASDEARDGISAFAQNRPPNWMPTVD